MPRSLVLFSGGLDSAVALWWTLREGHDVVPLSYRYRGRPAKEARAARDLAARAGLTLVEADLPFLSEPEPPAPGTPRGYIPARNAVFYAVACYHAETLGCELIVGGHNADDASRFADARAPFFARLEGVLADGLLGDGRAPRLVMPLAALSKLDVVRMGREMAVPLALAWSCYEDGEAPCGFCPACQERGGPELAEALAGP